MRKTAEKVCLISLGCPKNLVDSEVMLGILKGSGMELTSAEGDADVLIVNTCGFIGDAKEESIDEILALAEHKKTGRCRRLIVTGCLSQRYKEELAESLPEVDCFIGTGEYHRIAEAVQEGFRERVLAANIHTRLYHTEDNLHPGLLRLCEGGRGLLKPLQLLLHPFHQGLVQEQVCRVGGEGG